MKILKLLSANLSLFGEGGDGSGVSSGDADQENLSMRTSATDTSQGYQDTNDTNNVVSSEADARRAKYDEYIKGEGKDFYNDDIHRIVDKRLKAYKDVEATNKANAPIIDMLNAKYGTSSADELMKAIESDNAYWEQEAYDAGMDVQQYMEFQKLQRENKALLNAQMEQKKEEESERIYQDLFKQSEALKQKFPQFDIKAELQNPQFMRLLQSGLPVEHAYKTLHFDELMSNQVMQTAARTEQQVTDNIRAKGQRPTEAGLNSNNGFGTQVNLAKLNKAQRAELAERANRGETITFI